ncbi:MAG TPA: hypothetical protein VHR45_17215 [Thermoanaerobaculia bacterium]|nr:hypothetical protein [Thermoanaerobaculia bacterium]
MSTDSPVALWAATTLRVAPERYALVSLPPSQLAEAAALLAGCTAAFCALVRERDEVSLTVPAELWAAARTRLRAGAPGAPGAPCDPGAPGDPRKPGDLFQEDAPYRVITFDIDLALNVVGYLAPATARLAAAGVPIVPQCAFRKDHLLVHETRIEAALGELQRLIDDCRRAAASAQDGGGGA